MSDYKDLVESFQDPEYLAYKKQKERLEAIRASITDDELFALEKNRTKKHDKPVPPPTGCTNRKSKNDFVASITNAYYTIGTATFDDDSQLNYEDLVESAEIISAALAAYKESKNIVNRGFHYERTKYNEIEKSFSDQWEKECVQSPGFNFGYGILQDLMITSDHELGGPGTISKVCRHITPMDAKVAATVVQWFGTNCGRNFLQVCLNRCGLAIVENGRG